MKLFLFLTAMVFTAAGYCQDCAGYYFLQNNKTIEMTIFGKKGNVTARQVYTVSDVKKSGGVTTGHLNSEMSDEKGKSIAKSSAIVQCDGGIMKIDMKMNMPPNPNGDPSPLGETDVKMDKVYVEYPSNMGVGDNLKDASMAMDMDNKNGMKQSVSMELNNRKVEAKEKVTTSAGTWDCFKISFKSKMKIKTMGIGIPVNIDGTEWFAPGFGIVKSESKHGRTEITSVK
jgi:hypothetical protein